MAEASIKHETLKDHVQSALSIIYDELGIEGIKPIGDRILCKPIQKEYVDKTASGLFVVQEDDKRPRLHLVVAVADSVEDIRAGDVVVAGAYIGHPIEWEGEAYRLITEKDVLGVFDG